MTPTISVMEFEKLLLDERAQTAQLRVKVEELERERGIGVGGASYGCLG